jgi:hypothetical protein
MNGTKTKPHAQKHLSNKAERIFEQMTAWQHVDDRKSELERTPRNILLNILWRAEEGKRVKENNGLHYIESDYSLII